MTKNVRKRVPASRSLPEAIETEESLDELLSRPPAEVVELFRRLEGDVAIVGGGGKIGPSLVRMACRARDASGRARQVTVIDRFPDPASRAALERFGALTILCDPLDEQAVAALPPAANVIYMVGMKFGTMDKPDLTWAVNALIPACVARQCRNSRIVAFSAGCVYRLVPVSGKGSVETDPLEPLGEYPNSCVARERIFQHFSSAYGTKMVLLRVNHAVGLRYGVLADLAHDVAAGRPIDLRTGCANVIWQGDVNAATLRLLDHAACPPMALNLSGPEKLSIRAVATELGRRMRRAPRFKGRETSTALLLNSSKAHKLLGKPLIPAKQVIAWVGQWATRGDKALGKPTHVQTRDGKY